MGDIMNSPRGMKTYALERDILSNVCQIMNCMTYSPANVKSMRVY